MEKKLADMKCNPSLYKNMKTDLRNQSSSSKSASNELIQQTGKAKSPTRSINVMAFQSVWSGCIHPSIHPSIPTSSHSGSPIPALFRHKTGVQPGQAASPSQCHMQTNNPTCSHSLLWASKDKQIRTIYMFLHCGRKSEC